jgi:glycosyltransferase involved in cell wall biosynthesis
LWTRVETPFHRLFFPLTRYFYRHADTIVVYGEHVKRYLVSEGVLPERIFVAAHAVDNSSFNIQVTEEQKRALCEKLNIASAQKIILYLGRLEKSKGLPYLVEAFAKLQRNDAVLVLAGNGSELSDLQKLGQDLKLENQIRFAGYVTQEQAVYYYAIAWVYVLPSITVPEGKELWGLVVNEAFNQGVPVIATEAVGAAAGGLVQDGINGFIVPERNSDALATTLNCLLDSPELHAKMADNAYKKIQNWDNERMVSGFRDAIDYAIANYQ